MPPNVSPFQQQELEATAHAGWEFILLSKFYDHSLSADFFIFLITLHLSNQIIIRGDNAVHGDTLSYDNSDVVEDTE